MRDKLLAAASALVRDYQVRILCAVDAGKLDDARKFNDMIHGMVLLREQLELRLKEEE